MPSTVGYMLAAGVTAAALFFVLWWMLHSGGDETPWIPAGLAASVVMVVAAAAREVVMRRAWTNYILDHDRRESTASEAWKHSSSGSSTRIDKHAAALRAIQRRAAEADAASAQPEAHLDVYQMCQDYLANADEALRSTNAVENRVALRAGQERVRALQKHHLLAWARAASRSLAHEAQRRVLISNKIETAMRALDVIDAALKIYPDEDELKESTAAIQEFIVSVKVGRWVELAERASFKGQYRRAIDRYRDALFCLSRESVKEEVRAETAQRIGREIELLRARIRMGKTTDASAPRPSEEKDPEETTR